MNFIAIIIKQSQPQYWDKDKNSNFIVLSQKSVWTLQRLWSPCHKFWKVPESAFLKTFSQPILFCYFEQIDENRHSDFSPVCFHSWTKGSVVVLQLMVVWRIICNVHCSFLILNKKEHLYDWNINRGHIVFLFACVFHLNFPLSYLSVTLLSMVSFCICITSTFSLTSIYLLQTSPPS